MFTFTTHAVLRQAWLENIRPVLLVNKVDRLVTELKLTPAESHTHLQQLLEQVNAVMAQLISGDIMKKAALRDDNEKEVKSDQIGNGEDNVFNWDSGLHSDENDDAHLYFSPIMGNVVFGSAIDGWAFGIDDFAALYADKLGLNKQVLRKTLWGDFYFNSKTKKVMKGAQKAGKKSLFVQMIMDNIWKVYNTILEQSRDVSQLEKLASALNVKVAAKDLKSSDNRVTVKAIMSQWLPISRATLSMVADYTPSLSTSQKRE
ncbi:EFTUD1 [Bugula neritina]|uniref:EFTUD1 n=1 Tax=Bugula neritina TaxID=10212 RepID=A0A7J7J6J1_BUGNE|nr:EFTUD1 [Bugula neritina]